MLFHSVDFAFFFAAVFALYWLVVPQQRRWQNWFLLVVGYFFYACWDFRYLLLLLGATGFNFSMGFLLEKSHKARAWLIFGIVANLSILGFFKYHDFFYTSFTSVFRLFGSELHSDGLRLMLPIGISFYTFQNIGYLVDIYRRDQKACNNVRDFALFTGFFPQLISGPIPKARHLLPQLERARRFEYAKAVEGAKLIVLGLFEKMVIADNCALAVNAVYQDIWNQSGSTIACTAVLFSFQIYADFSGYSHMAIGIAKLLGIDLLPNFKYPYLARNIADFWRRWHISFSIWLRDYIYIPLGGNRNGDLVQARNLFIVFLASGIWHGATWNFVIYGSIHGFLYVLLVNFRRYFPSIKRDQSRWNGLDILSFACTFAALTLARIFFKSENVQMAFSQFRNLASSSFFEKPDVSRLLLLGMAVFLFAEWLQRDREHLLDLGHLHSRKIRFGLYFAAVAMIFCLGADSTLFIYSKF